MTSIGLISTAHDNAGLVQKDQRRMLDVAWSEDCDREKRIAWDAWQTFLTNGSPSIEGRRAMATHHHSTLQREIWDRYNQVWMSVAPYELMHRLFPGESRALTKAIDVLQYATCGLSNGEYRDSSLRYDDLETYWYSSIYS